MANPNRKNNKLTLSGRPPKKKKYIVYDKERWDPRAEEEEQSVQSFVHYGKRTESLLFNGIPVVLKDEFKAMCIRNHHSMKDVLIGLMEWYLEGGKRNLYIRNSRLMKRKLRKDLLRDEHAGDS